MTEVDAQAFLTGQCETVVLLLGGLARELAGVEEQVPGATDQVLRHVANVTHRGDDQTYFDEVKPIVGAALLLALQPTFDRLRRETDANAAKAKRLEEEHAKFLRDFEEFRRMKTPPLVQ